MIYYTKFNEIKTASKFVKIMKSNLDITLAVETKDGMFAMILKPKSWRFDDCYSVSMVAKDKSNANKGLTMIHKICPTLFTMQLCNLISSKDRF